MQMIILSHLLEEGKGEEENRGKNCLFPGAEQICDIPKGRDLPCSIVVSLEDWNKKVQSSTSKIQDYILDGFNWITTQMFVLLVYSEHQ